MIDKNCPCKKDCPDRSPAYCPSCKKFKAYRNEKQKEYDKRKREFDYKIYENKKWDKKHHNSINFKRGIIK